MWTGLLVAAAAIGGMAIGSMSGVVVGAAAFRAPKPRVTRRLWDPDTTDPASTSAPVEEDEWELDPTEEETLLARRVDGVGRGR
jgi:hypothetical protein